MPPQHKIHDDTAPKFADRNEQRAVDPAKEDERVLTDPMDQIYAGKAKSAA